MSVLLKFSTKLVVFQGFSLAVGKCSYHAKILLVLTRVKPELFIARIVRETGFTRRIVFRHLKNWSSRA